LKSEDQVLTIRTSIIPIIIPNEEVEMCGVYSAPNVGEYKPEDCVFLGKIAEKDKK